jgi:hypothetical protein
MQGHGLQLMVRLAMAKELDLDDGIIYITDQENMVDIMTANIDLNRTISNIQACELDWYYPFSRF